MAIGVFNSGIGGLTVLDALARRLPDADIVYLADQAMSPYGGRPGEEIVELTRAGCVRLFGAGCDLVVLACNTAAAVALRRLQQSWLPDYRRAAGRPVNVLGLIVPTIEAATGVAWNEALEQRDDKIEKLDILGIFSTAATAASRVYEIEIAKRSDAVAVFSEPCPILARQIEAGECDDALRPAVEAHVAALTRRIGRPPDRAILGCTHYEIIADLFRAALPPGTPLIHQPDATADAIERYLVRHPEFDPGHAGARRFLTTGQPGCQNGLVSRFWGAPLVFEQLDRPTKLGLECGLKRGVRTMRIMAWAALAVGLALAGVARADVVEAQPGGFQVKQSVEIAAPADKVWASLGQIGAWWNPAHTWSQDAKNLTLELKPGGCLCEALSHGGGARHLTVVLVSTGKTVILEGTLGPLIFSGGAGHLVWSLAEKDGHTTLTQTYYVGGYFPGGFDKIAPAVDHVLTDQIQRLRAYVETGKPAS